MSEATRRQALAALLAAAGAGCALPQEPLRSAQGSRIARWRDRPRGFNIGVLDEERHDDAFLTAAAGQGARLVRAFVRLGGSASPGSTAGSLPSLSAATQRTLARVLPRVQRAGLAVVLVPDWDADKGAALWRDAAYADAFAKTWGALAAELRGAEVVAGFDLLNEPNPPWTDTRFPSSAAQWDARWRRAREAIRAEDSSVPIVLQGAAGGGTMGLAALAPSSDPALVLSLHFYAPHDITHQQVNPHWPRVLRYPIDDNRALEGTGSHPGPWNRERLRAELAAAAVRGRSEGRMVYVGEFSCARWAPEGSALRWVGDSVGLFNEFGWAWTYHEFRGWPGWDAEMEETASRGVGPRRADAPMMRLLRGAMAA